ncbi:glycine betaine/L-proline transport ATP binding subunit [Striga asiatica]|uniref:Glycine betaine/L-proline transport ATP binding subunit n=1 Tax=Striga asiatica TaxID=4170 RepID=A0A5A7PFM9_STRAF|nr:glycine betaine/L-proline transport ATP binding subunit [Striga asiatica]
MVYLRATSNIAADIRNSCHKTCTLAQVSRPVNPTATMLSGSGSNTRFTHLRGKNGRMGLAFNGDTGGGANGVALNPNIWLVTKKMYIFYSDTAFCLPVKVRSFLRGCDGEDGWRSIADARAAADRDFPRPGAAETCGISNGSPARCCSYVGPPPVVSSTGEKCSRWAARRLSQTNLPGYDFLDFLFFLYD